MYFLLSIMILIVGGIMVASPRLYYDITEGWKHEGEREPSRWYLIHVRIGGVVFLLVGVVGCVTLLFL